MQHPETGRKDVPVAGTRVGFALTMAKRDGSTFSCVDTVTHQRMASLSVATNGSVVTVVWRGHPKCGANFRVTARFTLLPGGGFEYSGFDWAGNESPFYVHRVSFPEVAVPRTDRTAVFRPHAMGEVFRPDWRKFKPGKTVSATVADYLAFNCIATMDDGACSHFLDMRGEARRVSPTAFYVRKVHEDNPGFILSSETPSESYLDLFEAFILPHPSWERVGYGTLPEHEAVPAATVIYRDAAVLFGSYATPGGVPAWDPLWGDNPDKPDVEEIVAKYPDQFAVEFARGVVWGMQPMVHNFTMKDVGNPRIAHDIQYMKDTAKFYHAHRDFLFDGTLLKPAKLTCATKRTAFLSAGCYTRPQDGKVVVQKALPTVLHSEWRARDGREAAVLANWTMEPQTYRLDFGGGKTVSGTLAAREWRLVNLVTLSGSGEDTHKGESK